MRKSFLLLISLILIGCSSQITSVKINSLVIPVELASTPEQKAQGMMFRANLTGGMLFSYDEEQPRHFWMKNTLIPLDMLFINKNREIVTIHHAVPCTRDPCAVYSSDPAQYVLEVNGNFTEENNINVGMKVILE
ncbi:MAG TPA: DUF192 domain-containing protein [Candidatus Nanoarchaeia archaeon]|nr:DUF192 domain-containing protein [Candidatus Nanoarchaeia archaeon]